MTGFERRGVSRTVKVLLACAAAGLAALAVTVAPARACSCIPPDPWALLKQADGAFVGRLVSRREADHGQVVLVFRVDRAVKGKIGDTVEVRTASNGAACGIETPVGRRIGLFLDRLDGAWVGTLCGQVSPEDLIAAALLPAPNGRGPVAMFVGGRFGPARTLALDAKGRTLAYGVGSGDVFNLSVCPGGRRVAEFVRRGSRVLLTIRELPTLWLVREQRLPDREYGVATLRCVDARGETIALFSSGPDAHGLLSEITPRRVRAVWRGAAFYASFWRHVAYIQALTRAGTKIVAVDLRAGAARSLGTVRASGLHDLTPNAAGTRLAGDSFKEGIGDPRLVLIDLERRPLSVRTIPLPTECCGSARWITDNRFAFFSGRQVLVYDDSLRLVTRRTDWAAGLAEVTSRTAYGITARHMLITAELPSGPVRVVRRLPGSQALIVSATR